MYLKWRRGSPYVYSTFRRGKKVIEDYQGAYWDYYARSGNSWRSFLGSRGQVAVIIDHPERAKILDLIDARVRAAKKRKDRIVVLPGGTRKRLPR